MLEQTYMNILRLSSMLIAAVVVFWKVDGIDVPRLLCLGHSVWAWDSLSHAFAKLPSQM